MSATASRAARYQRDCQSLRSELTTLLDDLRDANAGGTVRYGVDFSEIFSYCARQDTFRAMHLFADDDEGTLRATETAALNTLFEGGRPLILFVPYAIEL